MKAIHVFRSLIILLAVCPACMTPDPVGPRERSCTSRSQPGLEKAQPLEQRATPVDLSQTIAADTPVKLTRDGALLTALTHSSTIEVARFGPQIAQRSCRKPAPRLIRC